LDEIASRLSALEPATTSRPPAPSPAAESHSNLAVEIREMDSLLRTVTEPVCSLRRTQGLGAADRLRDLTSLLVDLLVARPGENGPEPLRHGPRALPRGGTTVKLDRFQRSLAVDLDRVDGSLSRFATSRIDFG